MLKLGEILDNTYEIIEPIGEGGGGLIFKAYHLRLQKFVVVKLIKEAVKGKLDLRAEADILKGLRHTYLPQVYDFVERGDEVYTIIDFIEGESFDKLLKNKQQFTQKQVIKWAGQLSDAVQYLHSRNPTIVHSDIKPANIMLTTEGDICLIDFNISLALGNETSAIGISDGYSPPEQYMPTPKPNNHATDVSTHPDAATVLMDSTETLLDTEWLEGDTEWLTTETELLEPKHQQIKQPIKNESKHFSSRVINPYAPRIDVRSDIYSLGATLYHILTGVKPNTSRNIQKPLIKFDIPISDGLKYIIEKAMSTDPAKRFQTASAMHKAVTQIHTLDKRYKVQKLRQRIITSSMVLLFTVFLTLTLYGHQVLGQEKQELYYDTIRSAQNYVEMNELDNGILTAQAAMYLFQDKVDAYYITALSLFKKDEYENAISFIAKNISSPFQLVTTHDHDRFADLHFIMANSYFAIEDYNNAVHYYKTAIQYNENNSEYYRDYVISLARLGYIEDAERILDQVIKLGLSDVTILYIQAEISLASGNYDDSIEIFQNVISKTNVRYIKERSFMNLAKLLRLQGDVHKEIEVLKNALAEIGANNLPLSEMLGDAYVLNKQYEEAVSIFENLIASGYVRFYIYHNVAILYQNLENYEKAQQVLFAMNEKFPDQYKVFMQLAFLYADMENDVPNELRSYDKVMENYARATELYQVAARNNATDVQMLMLDEMVGEIQAGGWLNN